MATLEADRPDLDRERTNESLEMLAGGSIAEAAGGAGAVVLAILGLVGVLPVVFLSIATIGVGVALLFEGAGVAARYEEALQPETGAGSRLGGGITAEFTAGAAGTVLGILALLGVSSFTLTAIAAIVFGGGLLLSSGTTADIDRVLAIRGAGARPGDGGALVTAAGAQVFVGLAAAGLGVLAIIGLSSLTLTLVAMLAIGFSVLMSGSAVGRQVIRAMGH